MSDIIIPLDNTCGASSERLGERVPANPIFKLLTASFRVVAQPGGNNITITEGIPVLSGHISITPNLKITEGIPVLDGHIPITPNITAVFSATIIP